MKTFLSWINFIFKFTVIGLALAFIVINLWPGSKPPAGSDETGTPAQAVSTAHSYAAAVNRAAPSVVSIYTRTIIAQRLNPMMQRLFGRTELSRTQQGLGSGVIIGADGYVLTNDHVVRNTNDIRVALWDGRITDAEVVGTDPETDLAVLRISQQGLPVAPLGNTNTLQVGDVVLAIGNAVGLSHTVTLGIISATGRNQVSGALQQDFIQTDAAVNKGNSGGALVNASGEVIGINTSSLSQALGAEGISFAIPIDLASSVMSQQVQRGWIGAEFSNLPPSVTATTLGVDASAGFGDGIVVERVYPNGPAWVAGLQQGDVIFRAGGSAVDNWREFLFSVSQMAPGTELEMEVVRGGQAFTTRAELIQQPPPR
jgi:serine peptidase DegS